MKKFNRYFILFAVLSTAIFHSCKYNLSNEKDNNITFDTVRISDNYQIDNDSTMPSCNLKLTFIYPKSYEGNPSMLDSLQDIFISNYLDPSYATFKSTPLKALEKYKDAYIKNYLHDIDVFYKNKNRQSHDDGEKYLSFYETVDNNILYNKNDILSFQISQTNFKGGTTSYLLLKNYSIDLKTGKVIFEKDIFNADYEKALSEVFKEHLLRDNNVKTIADLEDIGYFGIDEITPNENLLIDNKGITYIFNKGEYSTYKLDPITIIIPYDEVEYLLKKDSPISQFIEE